MAMKSLMRPGTGRHVRVQQPQHRIAVGLGLADHADRKQVVHLVHGNLLRVSFCWME